MKSVYSAVRTGSLNTAVCASYLEVKSSATCIRMAFGGSRMQGFEVSPAVGMRNSVAEFYEEM